MKISGNVLYDLFRYAYKNDLFDEDESTKEISDIFLSLRNEQGKRCYKEYEIKLSKFGKY